MPTETWLSIIAMLGTGIASVALYFEKRVKSLKGEFEEAVSRKISELKNELRNEKITELMAENSRLRENNSKLRDLARNSK